MKKLNKFVAILVALAMMAALAVTSAFATWDTDAKAVTGGTEANPATGVLTKVLQMPEGTTTPETKFSFEWTQKKTGTGIETTAADETKLEGLIEFTSTDTGSTDDSVKKVYNMYNFANVAAFTKAGRYQFDVEETANTNATIDATTNTNETLKYSSEKYLVTIDVAQGESGLYIQNIAVQKYNSDGTLGEKDDPSDNSAGEGKGSNFSFTNTYVKTLNTTPDGKDPDDEDDPSKDNTGLFIQKDVAPYGQEALTDADKAAPFTFTVKVTAPSLSQKTSYKAKVVDTNAADKTAAVDVETTATKDATTKELTFTSGAAATVTLKHGQRLVFEDLDVGAKYEVAETADDGYTTAIVKTANDTETSISGVAITETAITEGKDSAEYTNTRNASNKPTGILISNLPYIVLALVAVGGLCAYVVVRRKADDEA